MKRTNPLLSFTVSQEEYKKLKTISEIKGVSIAQVGRGLFRKGARSQMPKDYGGEIGDDLVRLGVFPQRQ